MKNNHKKQWKNKQQEKQYSNKLKYWEEYKERKIRGSNYIRTSFDSILFNIVVWVEAGT